MSHFQRDSSPDSPILKPEQDSFFKIMSRKRKETPKFVSNTEKNSTTLLTAESKVYLYVLLAAKFIYKFIPRRKTLPSN